MKIFTLDTTLRAGASGEGVSFRTEEKLLIAQKLDELGIDYIEGGWPGAGTPDEEFFTRAHAMRFQHARLTGFGSARLTRTPLEQDASLRALLAAGTPTCSLAASGWSLHVFEVLRMTEKEHVRLISEMVAILKAEAGK